MSQEDYDFFVATLLDPDPEEEINLSYVRPALAEDLAKWISRIMSAWPLVCRGRSQQVQNIGLWRIASEPLWLDLEFLGPTAEIPLKLQIELVRSAKQVTLGIPDLIRPDEPMETGYFMWWDLLQNFEHGPDVRDAFLEVLSDLVHHEDKHVQVAALHGLGHLEHPGRIAVVDDFIRRNPDLADDSWVLQCRDGTVM